MKAGAGVSPFAVHGQHVRFLFQKVFSGRKAGHLIDFGGGIGDGESARQCAMREFVEETETMYLSADPVRARRTPQSVEAQLPRIAALFDATLSAHPDWWCRRAPGKPHRPKDWKTFFVEMPYRDPAWMNRAWRDDRTGRYKKRRELIWIPASELMAIYASDTARLWKRVRQLEHAPTLIRRIQQVKTGRSAD